MITHTADKDGNIYGYDSDDQSQALALQRIEEDEHSEYEVAVKDDATILDEAKASALSLINSLHQKTLLSLTDTPTQVEQTSWAGKIALSEAILNGDELTDAQIAFLSARGITEDADKLTYANTVQANNKSYWALCGLADKVRSDCKARVNAATDLDSLELAYQANKIQYDAAVASVS